MAHDVWEVPVRTSAYVMISSDYSAQEPRLTAFISQDKSMIESFRQDRDIYATIASMAFNVPYEKCLEFHPETHEYQPDGKERRGQAKTIVLGITYGRSVPSIGEQLYGTREDMTEEEKTRGAQRIYDAVLKAFPNLHKLMMSAQSAARNQGFTETILGRRRHLLDMQLPEFEFKPMRGYVNPDVDPLDPSTFDNADDIPKRIVDGLSKELSGYKYFGQTVRRIRELAENDKIKVINNRTKINDASRQCVNCVDEKTEILTLDGFKRFDQININDRVYGYDPETDQIIEDCIQCIHTYSDGPFDIEYMEGENFYSCSTPNHMWCGATCMDGDDLVWSPSVNVRTEDICSSVDNEFVSNCNKIITGASNKFNSYIADVDVDHIINSLVGLGKDFVVDSGISLVLTHEAISKMSLEQAYQVADSLFSLTSVDFGNDTVVVYRMSDVDVIMHLCMRAGIRSRYTIWDHPAWDDVEAIYYVDKLGVDCNTSEIKSHLRDTVDFVWCVTTNSRYWVARKGSYIFITHNSIIQGSAADQTKMAVLRLESDPRWKDIGGRMLVPVHDELVAEVPIEYWKEGGDILSSSMVEAADFLPFPSKCDVTTTLRWYGLEYPCQYDKPESLDNMTKSNIQWVQYHLHELEYDLPVIMEDDGSKPRGDAALGVNGKYSKDFWSCVDDYCLRRSISKEKFIDKIYEEVTYGVY